MTQTLDVRYALRLEPPGADPARLAGVIEHVLSGERRSFASAGELVTALTALQQQQAAAARG